MTDTIYERTKQAIGGLEQWTGDITLCRSKEGSIYISQHDWQLGLVWQLGKQRKAVVCGGYNVVLGEWTFTLGCFDYDIWVARVKRVSVIDVIAARYGYSQHRHVRQRTCAAHFPTWIKTVHEELSPQAAKNVRRGNVQRTRQVGPLVSEEEADEMVEHCRKVGREWKAGA